MRCDSGRNPKALTRLFSLLLLQAKAKGKPRAKPAKKRRARSSSDEPSEVRVCTAAAQHQSFPLRPGSAPRSPRAPRPQDEGDDDAMEEDEEFDMGMDLTAVLEPFLATEDGQTICTALVSLSKHMEMQNKILVKMLTQMSKK